MLKINFHITIAWFIWLNKTTVSIYLIYEYYTFKSQKNWNTHAYASNGGGLSSDFTKNLMSDTKLQNFL